MKDLTVKQLAVISGVTVRTLHHYDEIGLLKPAYVGENGYRYYGRNEMLRLQQILFHREFGAALHEIAELLDRPDEDPIAALQGHRERLERERERTQQLIATIDATIADLKREDAMLNEDLYKGFSAEKQAGYEAWLIERFGEGMQASIEQSGRALKKMSQAERDAAMAELRSLEEAVAEAVRREIPPDSPLVGQVMARHRAWVAAMWGKTCPPAAYAGLADLYLEHPDFRARFEAIAPGMTDYLATAMKAHAARG